MVLIVIGIITLIVFYISLGIIGTISMVKSLRLNWMVRRLSIGAETKYWLRREIRPSIG